MKPDFIFITEVLPKTNIDIDCISPLFNIEGYIAYPSKNTGRGVIIYAKSHFCVSPNEYMNSLYDDASWCNWVKDNKTVLIGSIYRSPSNQNSCLNIIGLLNEAARLYNNILIMGDFNMRDILLIGTFGLHLTLRTITNILLLKLYATIFYINI